MAVVMGPFRKIMLRKSPLSASGLLGRLRQIRVEGQTAHSSLVNQGHRQIDIVAIFLPLMPRPPFDLTHLRQIN